MEDDAAEIAVVEVKETTVQSQSQSQPEPEPEKKTTPPPLQPRRRLIQSTLFPLKPQEEEKKEEEEEKEDEECAGSSQGKGKRKGRGRGRPRKTPPSKAPSKVEEASSCRTENGSSPLANGKRSRRHLKEKHGDASPCKTLTPSKLKGPHCRRLNIANEIDIQHAPEAVIDLRLEAKLAAEENARLFTGKQPHPFFSSWKIGRKTQVTSESTEPENKQCLVLLDDESIKPFHVSGIQQDERVSLDWSKWTFCDEAILDSKCAPENAHSSFFADSVHPLKFDDFHTISDPSAVSSRLGGLPFSPPLSRVNDMQDQSLTVPPVNGLAAHYQLDSLQTIQITNIDTQLVQDTFVPERMGSYCCDRGNNTDNKLWTDRYQPEKASEVCGNNESVSFLSEWLGSWRERYSRTQKTSTIASNHVDEDVDYNCDENDSDAESMDGRDNLKNVLLVTGPVGSGKSAAIYACAKEQGFQVIEVSASDWRNGAHVKQKFGAAMESHGLNKWSPGLKRKRVLEFPSTHPINPSTQEFDDEVVEIVSVTCKEQSDNVDQGSGDAVVKDAGRGADRTLILFEDVDAGFDEDRGFIATVQQIAETAKRPIILTSNSQDPVLPDQLDRLEVSFETPSSEELLSYVLMVCAAEKADIQPQLIERLIKCCQSDIRKTIMMLQFWCQGEMVKKERNFQYAHVALHFELATGHWILPKVIPWGFPCQLSKLVEEEIAKSLSTVKENVSILDVVEEEDLGSQEPMGIEAKKEAMLSMNNAIYDDNAFPTQLDSVPDFSNSSDLAIAFTRRTARRGPSTVLSSHSGDEFCRYNVPMDQDILYGDISVEDYPDPSTEQLQLLLSEKKTSEQNLFNYSQNESDQNMCQTYQSFDVSCVPQSTFVPDTEVKDGMELQSMTVSCGRVADTMDVLSSLNTAMSIDDTFMDAENLDKAVAELDSNPETISTNPCGLVAESIQADEEVGDSHQEHEVTLNRGYQGLDECSQAHFSMPSTSGANPMCKGQVDSVQERWKTLRGSCSDLKLYLTSELKEARHIVRLASRMTDMISTTDLMFDRCQPLINDYLETSMVPSAEPDTFTWYDQQLEMASTIAEHGFCLFSKESTLRVSDSSPENRVGLAGEMLASTSNTTVLGKLVIRDVDMNQSTIDRRGLEIGSPIYDNSRGRETEARLYNMIQNVVPSKMYLALRGAAFHDYVSCLGQISKSEVSRLSACVSNTKSRRRTRAARHYLTSGQLTLSPEDASFLAKHSCYDKIPLEVTE